jgi:hypothetical protein
MYLSKEFYYAKELQYFEIKPGSNPTNASYNASVY